MFGAPQPTPFDLTFRLVGFPVRVHPLFWLGMALLGSDYFQAGFEFGLIWVACGFVSILVHELGHALAYRRYGAPATVWLYVLGGLAVSDYGPSSPRRRLVIVLAGPVAGFALLGVVWGSENLLGWTAAGGPRGWIYLAAVYHTLFWINLVWNLLNLLPIWPLDGGQACREILTMGGDRNPFRTALMVSIVTAGGLAVYGLAYNLRAIPDTLSDTWFWWATPSPYWTLFLFMLAVQSYMLLQQFGPRRRMYVEDDDRLPWERR